MKVRINKWRKVQRQRLLIEQDGRCCYCYRPQKTGTLDHIHPQKEGGTDDFKNLAMACRACNRAKGHMSVSQFRKFIKNDITSHWARRKLFIRGMRTEKRILKYLGLTP